MTKGGCTAVASHSLEEFVSTGADIESPFGHEELADERSNAWQELVWRKLNQWKLDPNLVADEGIDPPTNRIILLAMRLATRMEAAGLECPDSVVPDPNSGIVFKYRAGSWTVEFHVWDDGSIDRCVFDGTRLVQCLSI